MSEPLRLQLIERPDHVLEARAIGHAHAAAPLPFALGEMAGLLADGEFARVGRALYGALFPEGELRDALLEALAVSRAERQPLLLQLRFDTTSPSLPRYPWELIHDGEAFLVADGAVAMARSLDCAEAQGQIAVDGPLRVLLVSPRPVDLGEAGARPTPAFAALDELRKQGLVRLDLLSPPTFAALSEALSHTAYHVVHLDALGMPEGEEGAARLVFEDDFARADPAGAETLHSALFLSKAALAVLTPPPAAEVTAEALAALAPALVRSGMPAVVTIQHPLGAEQIERFVQQLYQGLAGGEALGTAVAHARGQLLPAESARFAPAVYLQDGEGAGRLFTGLDRPGGLGQAGDPEPLGRVPRPPGRVSSGYRLEPVFVDRARAVAETLRALARPGARACLWGLGGVGKTAVAREVVRRGAWRFPGGIIWLSLQGGRSLAALLAEIADFYRTLKHLPPLLEEARRQVVTLLAERAAGHGDVLLVLDNYEDVADDADLQALLDALPDGVHVLATSRSQPDTEGWQSSELRAMAAPDIERILRRKLEAQRLAVAPADEALVSEIAGLLDGYPLGVDLVVSLARSCPWAHIRDELRAQPPPPLVAILRTTVAQGLSDDQRQVGARLSVLRGPFPETAIAKVAGTAKWLPHVKRLRELSLLSFDGTSYGFDAPAREYLYTLLSDEEAQACHEQAYRYFSRRRDLDGLVEAYRHAMAAGHHAAARTLLSDKLLDAMLDAGRYRQLLTLLDAALAAPEAFDERFLLARAGVQRTLGQLSEALDSLERLLVVPDLRERSRALALHEQGRIYYELDDEDRGDHQRALDLYADALAICEDLAVAGGLDRAGRRWLDGEMAALLQDIAVVYQYALAGPDDLSFARRLYAISAGFWKRLRDPVSRATSEKQRAEILRTGTAEEQKEAKRIYRQVMQTFKRKGLQRAYGDALLQLAKMYQDERSLKHALKRFQEYEEIQRRLGLEREEAIAWKQQGEVWQSAGYRGRSVKRAVDLYTRAVARLGAYNDRWSRRTLVATLLRRGEGYLELRMPGEARSDFQEALARAHAMGMRGEDFDVRRLSQRDRERVVWAFCALAQTTAGEDGEPCEEWLAPAVETCRALGHEVAGDGCAGIDCSTIIELPGWAVHHKGERRDT